MVVAPHHLAAQAGLRVLHEGGNAIEAMVAAAVTIAVRERAYTRTATDTERTSTGRRRSRNQCRSFSRLSRSSWVAQSIVTQAAKPRTLFRKCFQGLMKVL